MPLPREGELVADRYRVERAIGRGAMGAVYSVQDERSQRRYALKWIMLEGGVSEVAQSSSWARREIKALQVLQHPSILQLFDHGATEDAVYVVTELLQGEDLTAVVDRRGPLSWQQAAAIGVRLCQSLAAAHGQGIMHRDVKPANLFLCHDGRFVLLDFGIAKAGVGERTDTMALSAGTLLVGTVSFLAPERVAGDPARAPSDIFAAAGTLQWLLTGRYPFPGNAMLDVLKAIAAATRVPIERADLPSALTQTLDRMFSHAEAGRPSAQEAARTLTELLGDDAVVTKTLQALALDNENLITQPTPPVAEIKERLKQAEAATQKASLRDKSEQATQIATAPKADRPSGAVPTESTTKLVSAAQPDASAKSANPTQIARGTLVATARARTQPLRRRTWPWLGAAAALASLAAGAVLVLRRSPPTPTVAAGPALVEPPRPPDALPAPSPPPIATPEVAEPAVVDDRPGTLALTFEHWVDLTLDGKSLGRKEFTTRLTLAPGKHQVLVSHPRFGSKRIPVDLRPGKTTALSIDLSQQ